MSTASGGIGWGRNRACVYVWATLSQRLKEALTLLLTLVPSTPQYCSSIFTCDCIMRKSMEIFHIKHLLVKYIKMCLETNAERQYYIYAPPLAL